MTTGERIRKRRKQLGVSAEQIAVELGVSAATIYRYEKGDIEKLPGNILEPLSNILRTTPAYRWVGQMNLKRLHPPFSIFPTSLLSQKLKWFR